VFQTTEKVATIGEFFLRRDWSPPTRSSPPVPWPPLVGVVCHRGSQGQSRARKIRGVLVRWGGLGVSGVSPCRDLAHHHRKARERGASVKARISWNCGSAECQPGAEDQAADLRYPIMSLGWLVCGELLAVGASPSRRVGRNFHGIIHCEYHFYTFTVLSSLPIAWYFGIGCWGPGIVLVGACADEVRAGGSAASPTWRRRRRAVGCWCMVAIRS
jgi:hypothetical protein